MDLGQPRYCGRGDLNRLQQAFGFYRSAMSTDGVRHVSLDARCLENHWRWAGADKVGWEPCFGGPLSGSSGPGEPGWGLPGGGGHRVHVGWGACERDWNQQVLLESREKERE